MFRSPLRRLLSQARLRDPRPVSQCDEEHALPPPRPPLLSRGSFRPRRSTHLGGGPGVPKPCVLPGGSVRGQQGLEAVTGHWLAFLVSLVVGGQIGDFSVLLLWTVFLIVGRLVGD